MNTVEMNIKYNIDTNELFINGERIGLYNKRWAVDEVKNFFERKVANVALKKVVRDACR